MEHVRLLRLPEEINTLSFKSVVSRKRLPLKIKGGCTKKLYKASISE